MGATLLDNLVAVVVGTMLLLTLVVLQMRQRIEAVDETIHQSVRTKVQATMGTLGMDLSNVMTLAKANDVFSSGQVRFEVASRSSDTLTQRLAFPTRLERFSSDSLEAAQVFYQLVPDSVTVPGSTGDSTAAKLVFVNGSARESYRLERYATFTPPAVADGWPDASLFTPVSSAPLVDFRVGLLGFSPAPQYDGPAPAGLRAARVSLFGALPRPERISSEQLNTSERNGVRIARTFRPSDL